MSAFSSPGYSLRVRCCAGVSGRANQLLSIPFASSEVEMPLDLARCRWVSRLRSTRTELEVGEQTACKQHRHPHIDSAALGAFRRDEAGDAGERDAVDDDILAIEPAAFANPGQPGRNQQGEAFAHHAGGAVAFADDTPMRRARARRGRA